MKSNKKSRRQLKKAFKHARALYVERQTKLEAERAKVEKHARKLQKLEVEVSKLERRLHKGQGDGEGQIKDKDATLRRARLIFKPSAGTNDQGALQLEDIVNRLRAHGIIAESVLKTSGKAVRALAKQATKNKEPLIIVAAGDGTIEDVGLQLIGSKTTLGVIPIGTMNNLARAWGVPLVVEDACALLGMGLTREIDVGRVRAGDPAESEYFLETAGLGLSAIVIPAGQAAEKHRWNLLPKALRKLFDSQPTHVTVELDDGQVIAVDSEVVTVSNSPLFGKNIMIAPDAKMDDGQLDIATYAGMGTTDLLAYFMAASDGRLTQNPKVVFHRAKRVRIRSDQPVDVHSDKEVTEGKRVLDIEIVPQALRVVVGKGIALTLPIDSVPSAPPLSGKQKETVTAETEGKLQEQDRSNGQANMKDKDEPHTTEK